MTDAIRQQAEAVLKSYNACMETYYTDNIVSVGASKEEQARQEAGRKARVAEWEQTPLEAQNGTTPAAFAEGLEDLDVLLEVFFYFSVHTFAKAPDCLVRQIVSRGDATATLLLDKLNGSAAATYDVNGPMLREEENRAIEEALAIVQILAVPGFGGEAVFQSLTAFMTACIPANELFLEQCAATLTARIRESCPTVIGYLAQAEPIGPKEEYLLSALSDLPAEEKCPEIYRCLKESFLRMPNHTLGAVFLGDYGDPKAIPVLRRFAMQNAGKIPMDDYYTVLAVIEALGGIIDDLLPQGAVKDLLS